MLHVLVLAALAATASPSPTPAVSPTPDGLRVIATVHASTACAEIATHANAAIASALANDTTLTETIKALHGAQLDGNVIKHRNGLDALGNFAKTLTLQALSGDAEVKRLRKLAEAATDPQRKKELKAFADWLGGAMWRQHKVARDLNGFLATMDFYDMSTLDESEKNIDMALFGSPDQRPAFVGELTPTGRRDSTIYGGANGGPIAPAVETRPTYNAMAEAAARDFELRLPAIASDESMAANHVAAAMAGC